MNKNDAYQLFNQMVDIVKKEIIKFTQSQKFVVEKKADKSVVTACDQHIDNLLSEQANKFGLDVISEEGMQTQKIVESGNYLTIDPIDGSLGYVEHVNYALKNGGINNFLSKDLGANSDFCLLLGIVIEGKPSFGCCYHYVTQEKILLEASNPKSCIIQNKHRFHSSPLACYKGQRQDNLIQKKICDDSSVEVINQATLGLKSLYTIINDHKQAVTIHRVQIAGLWDILPTAVAIKAFGGVLLDDLGEKVVYNKYIVLPGKGASVIKGDQFLFVQDELKSNPNI